MLTRVTHTHDASCACAYAEEIISFFAHKFYLHTKCEEEVFRAIEEWWFVPRSDEALRLKEERVCAASLEWAEKGTLLAAYHVAYAYATSDRCKATEAHLATYRS
jgi:hypothetical protein